MYVLMFSMQFVTVNGFSVILLMLKLLDVKIVVSCDVHEYFLLKKSTFHVYVFYIKLYSYNIFKNQEIWCAYMFTNF